jgi:glycosyltransferase involved in cell wall biosynthesis
MITANFFHIKSTNGLFFYGLDYLRENIDLVRVVLIRPELEQRMRSAFPGLTVIACSGARFMLEAFRAHRRGDLLFTPTSHPLPGIDRQWIVLHDAYPFEHGPRSSVKRRLLQWSLALSRCRVGHINRSDAQPFVAGLGVPPERQIFAPNRFPEPSGRINSQPPRDGQTIVGLLGTDSAKKNYDRLFTSVRRAGLVARLGFRVYGHDTAYFRRVCALYPELRIELARSDDESLDDFMRRVHVLASASEQEGFGRPIAVALLAGLPVELLDRPVFREFFSGGARFHADTDALAEALPRDASDIRPLSYVAPADVVAAYAAANDEIRRLGVATPR